MSDEQVPRQQPELARWPWSRAEGRAFMVALLGTVVANLITLLIVALGVLFVRGVPRSADAPIACCGIFLLVCGPVPLYVMFRRRREAAMWPWLFWSALRFLVGAVALIGLAVRVAP
jgi:uncharacterized membrane protein HdeD (DUF308 family)